jgi:hypothetical protein
LTADQERAFKGMASADQTKPANKKLAPAAERALAEAAERRAKADGKTMEQAKEVGGPSGPEPTRYGDWEKKGLTSDF